MTAVEQTAIRAAVRDGIARGVGAIGRGGSGAHSGCPANGSGTPPPVTPAPRAVLPPSP